MGKFFENKQQAHVVFAVTFGNILEWYEIYSYAYFAPVLSQIFLGYSSAQSSISAFLILFGVGFLLRPVGAVIWGLIGDRHGRKTAFVSSILVMTIPTFLIGFLPTYAQVGWIAPALLVSLRAFQSIPVAGESPGTACFLYEYADDHNKVFMTSWSGVGNQIGAIIGVIETFLIDHFVSTDFLVSWGWRISFWLGGLIGLLGIYLRKTLHETPIFDRLKEHDIIDKETIYELIKGYRTKILHGTSFCIVNAAAFYFLATYLPLFLSDRFKSTELQITIISLIILTPMTILLPVFGFFGDRFSIKKAMITAALITAVMTALISIQATRTLPLSYSIAGISLIICTTVITAYVPYCLTHLFPAPVRFTGVGLAFNIADGLVGGFTPAIGFILFQYSGSHYSFGVYIMICALISFYSYLVGLKGAPKAN